MLEEDSRKAQQLKDEEVKKANEEVQEILAKKKDDKLERQKSQMNSQLMSSKIGGGLIQSDEAFSQSHDKESVTHTHSSM